MNVVDEQEKVGEDAEGVSNAQCMVSFNVMSDEVENDWAEVVKGGRRSGRNGTDKLKIVQIVISGPLSPRS